MTPIELAGGQAVLFSKPKPDPDAVNVDRVNEDSATIVPLGETSAVLAVADGAGGHPQGADASQLAIAALEAQLKKKPATLRSAILDAFERANEKVIGLGVGAATTLAVATLEEDTLRPYHAGDSMILVVGQRGRQKLLTMPHSPVGHLIEAGTLDIDDALHHEDLAVLSNFVGAAQMRIEVGAPLELSLKDTVVIGSDGLFDNLRIEEIIEATRTGPLEEGAERLLELCEKRMTTPKEGEPNKPDDLTFVLFRRG